MLCLNEATSNVRARKVEDRDRLMHEGRVKENYTAQGGRERAVLGMELV